MTSHVHLNDLHPIVDDLETVNELIHDLVFEAPESAEHDRVFEFKVWAAHQRRLCYAARRLAAHMEELQALAAPPAGEAS